MDLSKAFDTTDHSLLVAKLEAHGFSNQALSLLQSYLCNRFQRSIINGSFSSWNKVITGVPQGSTMSTINYVTLTMTNTLYKSGKIFGKLKTIWKWIS